MKSHQPFSQTILLLSAMLLVLSASAQWTNINSLSNHSFDELNFPSQQTGYAIVKLGGNSGNALYKTENAGTTWEELTLSLDSITNPHLQSIFFVNDQTGFITLRSNFTRLKIFLLKTQDGGNNWANVTPDSLPVGYGISDVFFPDLNLGFVASGDRLYRTTNGGMNWTSSLNLRWEGFNEIHFHDSKFGIAGAWDGTFAYMGRVFTTSDGGQNWDSLFLPEYGSSIGHVMHVGDSTAFALTDHGWRNQKIHMTTNNGNSWDTLSLKFLTDSSDVATDFHFEDASNGYLITSNGYIFRTHDCGKTWVQEYTGDIGLEEITENGSTFFVGGPVNTLLTHPNTLGLGDAYVIPDAFAYPNPCSRRGILNFKEPLTGEFRILDLNGKLIFTKKITRQKQIPMEGFGLVPGLYLIQLQGKKQLASKLLVKE